MNEHKYSKWDSKGYANKHGWIVRHIPFYTLFEAEHYCTIFDLNPDDFIEYNPKRAKELAFILMDELSRIEHAYQGGLDEQRKVIDRLAIEANSEGKKDLLASVHAEVAREYLLDAVGNYSGRSAFYQLILNRKLQLINLTSMRIQEG